MLERLSSLKGKAVRHLSHNDGDGYGPQIASRFSSLNTLEYIHCGYNNFEQKLTEAVEYFEQYGVLEEHGIIITDIAPKSEELVMRLNELFHRGLGLVLLDHHDTNRWIAERYPQWAFIESSINGRLTCGTELYHIYLKEKGFYPHNVKNSKYLDNFVDLIRSYDTWEWTKTGNETAKNLNNLLYIFSAKEFMETQVEKIAAHIDAPEGHPYVFTDTEQLLIDVDTKAESKYIRGRAANLHRAVWTVNGTRYNVGQVYADQFHSVLGNKLHDLNPDLDFIALFDMNKAKVSLRTIHPHIHVGNIAKEIDPAGGGHPPSAGFPFNYEESFAAIQHLLGVGAPAKGSKRPFFSKLLSK